jgi:hypothetical protein
VTAQQRGRLFSSLRGYRAGWFRGDAIAGLTVWAVLVPEALAYATIAYLNEQGMAVDDYVRFFGRRFAPGWEELRGQPVAAVARAAARNAVSVGGTLRALSGDEANAEVLIEGWPDEEISGALGLERSEGEQMWVLAGRRALKCRELQSPVQCTHAGVAGTGFDCLPL